MLAARGLFAVRSLSRGGWLSPREVAPGLFSKPPRHAFSGDLYHSTRIALKQERAMLARAAKEHKAIPPPKEQALLFRQQSLSSPTPMAEGSTRTNFPRQALQPSSSSAVNGVNSDQYQRQKNPLKRTASEAASGMAYAHSSGTKPIPALHGCGIVGKLHESVYFDENDFCDDADINLDDDSPIRPSLPPLKEDRLAKSSLHPAKCQAPVKSSQEVDWSSSPAHHKATPPNAALLRRQQPVEDLTKTKTHEISPNDLDRERPSKRRTIPWLGQEQTESTDTSKVSNRGKTRINGNSGSGKHESTPLPKDKVAEKASPYPWNKTASAVKEEQKKHRQMANQGKKIAETKDEGNVAKKAKMKIKGVHRVFLSDEQKRILDLVCEQKKSVFFTGSAGTGKSVLMREIISALRKKFVRESDRVAVTASTGLAACNVGGVTLHSFSGIGLGKEPVEQLVKKIKKNQKSKHRWMRTKVLVIDEISMVDGDLFDKLEQIARIVRNNGRPFGGIQLVVTGDFFQLPPVPDYGKVAKFAFDGATWSTSIQHTIGLTQVFRQRDEEFASMLNEMRVGRLSAVSIEKFRALSRNLEINDDIEATELFPTRNEVDVSNNTRMRHLGGSVVDFHAIDGGSIQDAEQRARLLQNCMAPPKISLKVGAQVMLIKNFDDTLVNGSIGKVIKFMDEKTYDYFREDSERLHLEDVDEVAGGAVGSKLKSMINKDLTANTSQKWPLVQFQVADGSTRELLCTRESWKIELPSGEVQASRSQVPLILAWALSIHKAQGQTLERVRVDLGKIFEKGQAYVALSRATTQEGLQVLRFDPKKVMAHERVRLFYDSLYSADKAGAGNSNFRSAIFKGRMESFGMGEYEDDFDTQQEAWH